MKFLTKYENIEAYSNEAFRLPYPNVSLVKGLPNKKSFYREEPAWVKCVYEIPSEAFESTSAVTVLNSTPGYINDYKINGDYGEVEPLRVEEGVEVDVFQPYTMEGMQVYLPTTDVCFLIPNLSTETEFTLSRPLNETDIMVQIIYNGSNELVDLQLGGMVGDLGEYINIIFSFRSDTIYTYSDYFLEAIKEQASDYEGMKLGFFFVNSEWYDNPLEAPSLNTTMIGNAVRGGVQKVEVLPSMLDENNKVVIEYGLSEHDNTINNTFRDIDYLKEIDFTRLNSKNNSKRKFQIASEAFIDCSGLEKVKIGDYIISIDDYAFAECSGLASVEIGSRCTSIGSEAFYACTGLTGELVIPDSVTSIGNYAFQYCSGLTSMVIGSGVTSIGVSAFYDCSGLTGELVIPDSVKSIGSGAFDYCSELTSLELGSGVTSIGDSAFNGCSGLKGELIIPDSVTNIGNWAFNGCSGLESIIVSSGNTVYDSRENCNCIIKTSTNTLFQGCKNSFIPDSVTSIGSYSFESCSGLTNIEFGSGVTSIGEYAFRNCYGLTSIAIPDSVTSISDDAFYGCSGLTSVEIGNGVTIIGREAFCDCSGLTSVTFGNGVTSIGYRAFSECSALTSVVIPNSVKSIGSWAFSDCTSLTNVVIGSGCTNVGMYAFSGCASLPVYDNVYYADTYLVGPVNKNITSCIIKEGTKWIGTAFAECSGLTSVVIPNSVKSIGDSAFRQCSGLTSVVIPDSVISIGNHAFQYCTGLASVEIGSGCTSISGGAFYNCSNLTKITCHAVTAPSIDNNTFYKAKNGGTLYVPSGSDYSSWMRTSSNYLGYYGWKLQYIS